MLTKRGASKGNMEMVQAGIAITDQIYVFLFVFCFVLISDVKCGKI